MFASGSDGQRIDVHPDPPGGLIAIAVQVAVVQATDWNGVFVADLAAEGARLGEAKVVQSQHATNRGEASLMADAVLGFSAAF